MALRVLFVIAVFLLITVLFRQASGSLSIKRLNLISVTYYVYVVMVYLGAALAYCGLVDGHYLIAKQTEDTISFTYAAVAASGIGLGVVFTLFSWLKKWKSRFNAFFEADAVLGVNPDSLFTYVALCSFAGFLCTAYTFCALGGLPIVDVLVNGNESAATVRWNAVHSFSGNTYIRNIGMISLVPLCNLMAFAGWRIVKTPKWAVLFGFSSVLAALVLTWDLEKAPIACHVLFLYVLACLLDFKPSNRQVIIVFGSCVIFLLLGYLLVNGGVSTLSFESGPLSRLVTTPSGTLGLHFQYFPDKHEYLNGSSFPTLIASLFGQGQGWVRSGAIVMQFANPSGVAANTAGVMNAFFIGEAYANWGQNGIIASILIVGLIIGCAHNALTGMKKTYFTVVVYSVLVRFHFNVMMGGFVDYLNPVSYLPILIVLLPLMLESIEKAHRYDGLRDSATGSQ